ncbi:MAG: hypothetical protein LAO19_07740 [Acidobacteriia bacterium]|nr:hypothetical protein [Terriglobia bacterium]
MLRFRSILTILALCVCALFAGCRANGNPFGSQNQSGNSSVVLAVTDTPPSTVSVLSAEVTLTGATLTPGNVSIFSGSTTIELTRLQTDVAFLATAANVPAGAYTGVTLTFANPLLTIENDTNAAIGGCAVGSVCTIAPTSVANLSTTASLQMAPVAANSTAGVLLDVNLDNLLSATLGADFKNGVTASPFTPAGAGAPLVGAEDVVGQVTALDAAHNSFTFQNATGTFSLAVDGSTSFFQVPGSACTITAFSGIHVNQILSVDIGIHADGTLGARNLVCEDSDNSDAEIEGMITATNVGQLQFSIVTLAESVSVSGLHTGDVATVHYSAAPQTPFDIDLAHADNVQVSTAGFLFAAPTDLSIGQQVSIRRNAGSSGTSITADRVRLRSSRISANVQSVGAPNINLGSIPSIFSGHGVTQIQVQTSPQTILSENNAAIVFTQIPVSGLVSARGQLFNVSGTRTMVATKVVLKP